MSRFLGVSEDDITINLVVNFLAGLVRGSAEGNLYEVLAAPSFPLLRVPGEARSAGLAWLVNTWRSLGLALLVPEPARRLLPGLARQRCADPFLRLLSLQHHYVSHSLALPVPRRRCCSSLSRTTDRSFLSADITRTKKNIHAKNLLKIEIDIIRCIRHGCWNSILSLLFLSISYNMIDEIIEYNY